jgi:hypothetical protein
MKDFNLFSFGCEMMRLQSSPSQVELHEMEQPFLWEADQKDVMAGCAFENQTEAQRNCPVRINRKTD